VKTNITRERNNQIIDEPKKIHHCREKASNIILSILKMFRKESEFVR
jgi:hypothetical protein